MQYRRSIQYQIESQLDTREIIVITGMRRVGKTTLMKMLYDKIKSKNKVFLDIDNILDQKIFEENDFNNIISNLKSFGITKSEKSYIFLDEIQSKPDIVKPIKYLYDHYDVKFILTGSSSYYLKNLFPESLAGRKIIFELFPLTFMEFLIFNEADKNFVDNFDDKEKTKNKIEYERFKNLYEEYLKYGGFPQVVLAKENSQKELYLKDIFTSYFEKDVRGMADFKNIQIFRDLLILLMQRVGSKLEITKLSSELGVSRDTIYSYLSFLEGTYFISLVQPFSRNVDREISGTKKVYCCDNGFLEFFSRVSDGVKLENAVFQNLRQNGSIKYFQKRSGAEIDFILFDKKMAFEIKKRAVLNDYNKLQKLAISLEMNEWYVISQKFSDEKGIVLAQDI